MYYQLYWNEDTHAAAECLGTYDNLEDLREAESKYDAMCMRTYVIETEVKPND